MSVGEQQKKVRPRELKHSVTERGRGEQVWKSACVCVFYAAHTFASMESFISTARALPFVVICVPDFNANWKVVTTLRNTLKMKLAAASKMFHQTDVKFPNYDAIIQKLIGTLRVKMMTPRWTEWLITLWSEFPEQRFWIKRGKHLLLYSQSPCTDAGINHRNKIQSLKKMEILF